MIMLFESSLCLVNRLKADDGMFPVFLLVRQSPVRSLRSSAAFRRLNVCTLYCDQITAAASRSDPRHVE
jgi:hypothetical protein